MRSAALLTDFIEQGLNPGRLASNVSVMAVDYVPGEITQSCVIRHIHFRGPRARFERPEHTLERDVRSRASCRKREISSATIVDSELLEYAGCGGIGQGDFTNGLFRMDWHASHGCKPAARFISGPDINIDRG